MNHYLDIRLRKNPEITPVELMNALFSKLHLALAKEQQEAIGVSFPEHGKTLGNCLRLHGAEANLQAFMASQWLHGLHDYAQIGEVLPALEVKGYRSVRRVQAKSAHNKRKRSIAKGWVNIEDAEKRIPNSQQKTLKLPYAEIKSGSNGNRMRVYVEHGPLQSEAQEGRFNSYGLSRQTTIPWF